MIDVFSPVLKCFGRDRIHAVIGGTRLGVARPARFDETLDAMDRSGIERVGMSRCTGLEKAAILHARPGNRFLLGCVGAELEG
jgi:7,8-dihydropterin-6-yl-methyl-4-(beta-D-ribofuranosyl)aminobenzene 5'-phosphate synthase